jgi:apolipoprotein N-acyltransferase
MKLLATPALPRSFAQASEAKRQSGKAFTLWILLAASAFYLSYFSSITTFLVVVYLFALVQLAQAAALRRAFYGGFFVGLLIAVGKLDFFWRIFGAASMALWCVYAFWTGFFVLLAKLFLSRLSSPLAFCALPFVWCGLEYFRSELYYLRFSWLTPGMAFGLNPCYAPIGWLGIYGVGFLLMTIACAAAWVWSRSKMRALSTLIAGMAAFGTCAWISQPSLKSSSAEHISVAGLQLEFPTEKEVLRWLNELDRRHPEAQLLVLSEYTFASPVPKSITSWCRNHRRFLIIGAKEPISGTAFFNTAFVVGPSGEILFRQAKSVPIQFFDDGLPAAEQRIWESPWGKIGICICYDLSYARVTDKLVKLGAQMLIVPTMDVADWGRRQHELHARVGPLRSAEYHLPIFRLASSGISQAIDSSGHIITSAAFPGQGEIIAASLSLNQSAIRPLDRWLAPISVGFIVIALAALIARAVVKTVTKTARCY